jgi:hypothetical protein
MADYTESSNGNLIFRIAAAGGAGHFFEVRSRGSAAPQFTVNQDKSIVLQGDFLRDAMQIVNNTDTSTDIAQFQSNGSTVASIAKGGTGVFSSGGAQIPSYTNAAGLPASGAPGDIVLYDDTGAGTYFLYLWDASGAVWTQLKI